MDPITIWIDPAHGVLDGTLTPSGAEAFLLESAAQVIQAALRYKLDFAGTAEKSEATYRIQVFSNDETAIALFKLSVSDIEWTYLV